MNQLDIPRGDLIAAIKHFGIELPSDRPAEIEKIPIKSLVVYLTRYYDAKLLRHAVREAKLRAQYGYYALTSSV